MNTNKKPFEYYLAVTLFSTLIIICFLQVLFRFVLNFSLAWTEELSRFVFIALIYTGASLAASQGKHVRVELIDVLIPKKLRWMYYAFINIVCCCVTLLIAYNSIEIVKRTYFSAQLSAAMQFPMWIVYMMVPILFTVISIRFIYSAVNVYRNRNLEVDSE